MENPLKQNRTEKNDHAIELVHQSAEEAAETRLTIIEEEIRTIYKILYSHFNDNKTDAQNITTS